MLQELTKRELFILEAVQKGKSIANGQSSKSLTHEGLVAGEAASPALTEAGEKVLSQATK